MKILNTEQIREADQYTIRHEPISSLALMERAAKAFVKEFQKQHKATSSPVYILCGSGNNGGDGLAIARLLLNKSYSVHVFLFPSENYSIDHQKKLERLQIKFKKNIHHITDATFLDKLPADAILIDAIFGTGLNKPIKKNSFPYKVIDKLNQRKFSEVIAVDIPSGLFAGQRTTGIAVAATRTYTFQFPKLSFLLPENGKYVQDFSVLDIKLHKKYIEQVLTPYYYTTAADIRKILIARKKFAHKGTYGHAFIAAGSYGKMGAALLSSKACLRSGCGLVSVHIPSCGYEIFTAAFPEAMCSIDKNKEFISEIPADDKYDAMAVGPGIGTGKITIKALENFLHKYHRPLVLDADALNIISLENKLLKLLPANSILTPHPKEFERLAGKWKNDLDRLQLQREFSKKYKVIVVLKGANTGISDPDGNVYFNSTGNPGMATAGSGDVLTGIITGCLAQGYSPLNSSILGVFIHGLAGDMALKKQSMESLIASDLSDQLGNAFKKISSAKIG